MLEKFEVKYILYSLHKQIFRGNQGKRKGECAIGIIVILLHVFSKYRDFVLWM